LWQKLLQDSSFYLALLLFDRDLAEEYRQKGCPCGGRLHRASYARKPRGGPSGLPEGFCVRESFCCSRDGCRRRLTPPSLRFLGRKVYLGAVVMLVTAMVHGVTDKRAKSVQELYGVSRRSLSRWRKWWRESFVGSDLWRLLRGRFAPPVDELLLPSSLLERIETRAASERVLATLRLLLPMTTGARCVVDY
jgi:hypothetical protein